MTRRAVLKGALVAGAGTVAGTGVYGYAYERHALEVTRASLPVAGLPAALAGLRIGLITDIHRSLFVSHDDVARAVAGLMTEKPDLIVRDLDLDMIRTVRDRWAFYRDRRPDAYDELVAR